MKGLEQSKRLMDDPRVAEMLPPEQMEQYQKAFGMGMTMLYDQKFIPNAVKMLQSAPSPAAGIGNVVATIGSQIYMRAAKAGDQIAANVLPLAGMDLVREVAEFGEKFADMGEVGRVATPMGAGQIVGSTLRRTAEAMGLPDDTVFTPEVQMSMVDHLASQALAGAKTQDQKRSALRGVWEGFKNVPDAKLDAAIASYEAGDIGVSFANPNSDQYAAIEDPNTSAGARGVVVQDLARQRGLGEPSKLTGEEWIPGDKPGTEILVGYDEQGRVVPRKRDGKPVIRSVNETNKQKSISATMQTQIRDWADKEQVPDNIARKFMLEVERLVNDEGMTEIQAWDTAMEYARKSEDVTTVDKGWIWDTEKVKPGSYDGTFGQPRGLGDSAETPDAPDMPKEPTKTNAMPAPKTKAEFDALPKGTQFIDPDGNVRVKT